MDRGTIGVTKTQTQLSTMSEYAHSPHHTHLHHHTHIQWLGLLAPTAGGPSLIPVWGTRIPPKKTTTTTTTLKVMERDLQRSVGRMAQSAETNKCGSYYDSSLGMFKEQKGGQCAREK